MDAVRRTEAEPDFVKGASLMQDPETLDDTVNVLGSVYGKVVEVEGDLGPSVAPIAYAYGHANLLLAVKSNQAFVNAEVKKKQKEEVERARVSQAATNEAAAKDDDEEQEEGEEEEEEAYVMSREEIEDVFQIAFESLDTSRVIYERLMQQEPDLTNRILLQKRLAEVMMRLGDLKLEQGLFADSMAEYKKCLEIRTVTENSISRDLASAHHAMALASESLAAEVAENIQLLVDATIHYSNTLEILLNRAASLVPSKTGEAEAASSASSGSKKKMKPTKNWLDVLSAEQIEAIDEACAKTKLISTLPTTAADSEFEVLRELITDLANKIDDMTYPLTKEGHEEEAQAAKERKRNAAEAQANSEVGFAPVEPGKPQQETEAITTMGFGTSAAVDEQENMGAKQSSVSSDSVNKSPAKPVNVISVRKKAAPQASS
jgi:hypothetical protein